MNRVELYSYAKTKLETLAHSKEISQERLETVYYQPSHEIFYGTELNHYFYLFCGHITDRQYMKNIIEFYHNNSDTQNLLEKILFNYDPKKVTDVYRNAEEIKAEIKKISPSKIKNETKWNEYLTGIYQCAEFLVSGEISGVQISFEYLLKNPENIDEMKIYLYNLRYIINHMTGVGSAVCYNWLKECGAYWLAKPDMHIKRVVAELLKKGLSNKADTLNSIKDTDKIISLFLKENPSQKLFPKNDKIVKGASLTPDEFVTIYMYQWAEEIKHLGEDETCTAYKLDRILYLYCTNGYFYLETLTTNNISETDLLHKIQE